MNPRSSGKFRYKNAGPQGETGEVRSIAAIESSFTFRQACDCAGLRMATFRGSYVVSIMEFRLGRVAHETQYFSDRFESSSSRTNLVGKQIPSE